MLKGSSRHQRDRDFRSSMSLPLPLFALIVLEPFASYKHSDSSKCWKDEERTNVEEGSPHDQASE